VLVIARQTVNEPFGEMVAGRRPEREAKAKKPETAARSVTRRRARKT
jgi:hypothetical protein